MRLILEIVSANERGRLLQIDPSSKHQTIGRGENADLKLHAAESSVSRSHALVNLIDGSWVIARHPDSSRPLMVDGVVVKETPAAVLGPGSVIDLGSVRLVVREHSNMIGRYKVVREIGSGAEGSVFQAYDSSPVGTVAVKVLRLPSGTPSIELQERIRRFDMATSALQRIRHPNVVRYLDAGTDQEGCPFHVMEYIDGGTLANFVPTLARCGWPSATLLFVEVLKGLEAIHHEKLLHRDIKPGNILISGQAKEAVPKIADFGLVRGHFRITRQEDGPRFTAEFSSPEQIRNFRDVDQRADIYSVGASLYFALTGEVPVSPENGESSERYIHRVMREHRTPVRKWGARLPQALAKAVDSACNHDPNERFDSAKKFRLALEEVL